MPFKSALGSKTRLLFSRVDAHAASLDYRNKQAIYEQGDKADAMFYIHAGHVKLTVISKRGKRAVVAVLGRGDFFGEGCLVSRSLRVSTASAILPTTVARVKKATVIRIIHEEPEFARLFIAYLLSRIGRFEDEFVDQIFSSSEIRLAGALQRLASTSEPSKLGPVVLRVSQQTLAEMVGTTRSRVSHFMNRFRTMGLIDYGGRLNGNLRVHKSLSAFLQQS